MMGPREKTRRNNKHPMLRPILCQHASFHLPTLYPKGRTPTRASCAGPNAGTQDMGEGSRFSPWDEWQQAMQGSSTGCMGAGHPCNLDVGQTIAQTWGSPRSCPQYGWTRGILVVGMDMEHLEGMDGCLLHGRRIRGFLWTPEPPW